MSAAALTVSPSADLSRSTEADGLVVGEGFCQTDSPYARIYRDTGETPAQVTSKSSSSKAEPKREIKTAAPARASVKLDECLPPSSPFGATSFQSSGDMEEEVKAYEAKKRLEGMHLPQRLLSGLSSLSHNDFALYMQLTEELTKELDHPETDTLSEKSSGTSVDSKAQHSEEQLQQAVKKLESMLPKSAITQLQSHASYGLLDLIHSRASNLT